MRRRLLAPLRPLVLSVGLLLCIVFPGLATRRAEAQDDGNGSAAPHADLGAKVEQALDEGTAEMRAALHEAIESELERWQRRSALTPETRAAADRTLASVAPDAALGGKLLDGGTRQFATLGDMLERIAQARVIYVAEQHDNAEHHQIQLRVIQAAFKSNPKLIIGMEQFERPLQKHLDDYTQGRIDEATFLARVDWQKSWGFDWNLYKPILDFAHDYKLKVVALNAAREIVRKVGKGGLASLAEEDRKQIAREIDTTDAEHKKQFMKAFAMHGGGGGPDPGHYYESMCVWDETMAESAARILQAPKYEGATMVVLAGGGHIAYRFGIPERVKRRVGLADLTIIPTSVAPEDPESDLEEALLRPSGDFIYFTGPAAKRHEQKR